MDSVAEDLRSRSEQFENDGKDKHALMLMRKASELRMTAGALHRKARKVSYKGEQIYSFTDGDYSIKNLS